MSPNNLWVFGYGSLCWNPGFNYSDAHLGYVKGFKRRFWQGNNSHRGTEDKLGRVVTLIEEQSSCVWGKAFQLDDEKASRTYLDTREVALGGYTTIVATFEPLDKTVQPFPVMIYIALEENEQYLGKASYEQMARDIITSKGASGHNLEYLAKLAKFMRNHLPHIEDDHLYLLEQMCIFILKSLNSSLIQHFECHQVEKKWLNRIQVQLNYQYRIKKSNSLENTSSIEQSDEEIDIVDLNNYVCCDLVNNQLIYENNYDYENNNLLINNYILNNQIIESSNLLKTECRYNKHDKSNKENFRIDSLVRKNKKNNYSDFNRQHKWYKRILKDLSHHI